MSNEKLICAACGKQTHAIKIHIEKGECQAGMTLDKYTASFPTEPLMSELALQVVAKKVAAEAAKAAEVVKAAEVAKVEASGSAPLDVATLIPKGTIVKKALHEVFELGAIKLAMSLRGEPIPISVLSSHDQQDMVPVINDTYVYDADELKNVIIAMERNYPCYVWGHKGSGKSELIDQVCARTNRPLMRVQHTVDTEGSHIAGQWTVRAGNTIFELGPLAVAMQNGWTYCADEYDFGMPSVLAVYQAVLEGKALVIKEAPAELRIIKPHPNFRFCATGNTNGSGDETGLYQGTMIQNSANYDRFGMVINKQYMGKKAESQILQNRCRLTPADADKMIEFATLVRQAYDGSQMSDTISPRTLIYASEIGVMRGSFRQGLALSFMSKLTRVDKEVAEGLAQRIFA